ncbi:CKAP5 [Lepeophtheirus salmonis]|uniref:CKAP5 n=1 Tax=Lepeophtheirus salmonis TaxID=72036 RepID=A0A7R8D172_LEPSM|nr:CKAP5 [Lepeophtheirus salmonis]CAF2992121.1 CKAP5 [Lepeophtheirus salmonis]
MAEDDSAYLKLPVEERCTHKIWKARLHGYEEVVKLFNSLDGDDEQWRKFHGLIKKFVMDINAVAQEKGLQAALYDLFPNVLVLQKLKPKDLAGQICLMFCEIETHDKVIEELFKGLSQKNPKTVAGCITIITACLRAFGTKVIKVSPLLKSGIPLLDHRDKGIREECKKLIIESYRWVGEIMKTQLTALKPVQLTELETEFEKLENVGKAKPARFIRSQQALSLVAGDEDNGDDENGCVGTADSEEEAIDPYDLIEPVDILSKIPKNFFELHVWKSLKKKKTTVVSGLQEAVDAMYPILGIETIQEDVLASLKHKTPAVNAESAKYLARCFAKCPALLVSNKKLLKSYITVLLEKLSVSDPSVRDSSSEALGVLMKFLGESSMMKFMPDLDNIKLSKIKEFCEKAELSGKSAAQLQAAAPKAKVVRPSSAPKVKIVSAASSSNDINKDDTEVEEDFTGGKKASSSDGNPKEAKTSSSKSRFENVAAVASKKKKEEDTYAPYINDNLKNSRFKDETKFKVLKWNFITPRPDQMFHNDFKQHIKVIDSLIKYLPKDLDGLKDNLDLILKWFTLRFFETNPTEDSYVLHEIEATSFVPYLVNKVGDPKEPIRNSIKEIFKIMSQVYAANKLVSFFMNGLLSKNSKQRTECLDELAHLIKGYGISVLQPSPSNNLKEVAKQISDRDTSVRNAAMNTIAETYFQEGEKVYKMIGNLPKKEMTMLEERIKRASKTRQSVIPQEIATSPSNDRNANNNSPAPKAAQSGRSNPNPGQTESSLAEQQMVNQNNINDINEDINNQSNSHNNQHSKCCHWIRILRSMLSLSWINSSLLVTINVVKLFQFTTMALMYLYHRSDIPKNTSLAHLHNLIEVMINILTEPKVHELPDSSPLIKNMAQSQFADLVMKCLWRIIRRIEQEMPQIQIDVLLAELHEFLKANPTSYWKMQEADTHLRTVKTIVYTLAKAKGPDIMNHLGKISDPENSDLVPYLQKLMNGVLGTKKVVECYKVSSSTSKLPQFSKTHNETLAEIFKKIEQKELAKQGLKELYNFKQQNPLADLEPFFGRVSQYFRDYIEKGLKNIEMEVKSGSIHANFTLASGHVGLSSKFVLSDYVSNHGKGGSSSGQAYTYFLDRLKCLRTAGGLDNDDIGQEIKQGDHSYLGIFAPQSTIGSKTLLESPSDIHTSTSSNTRSNDSEPIQIDDIRRRLEKIKQSAFN